MNEADRDREDLLVFITGGRSYAVRLGIVAEVVRAEAGDITNILSAEPLYGLLNLRGRVVPVLDSHKLLGLDAASGLQGVATILVLDSPHGVVGLFIDSTGDVCSVDPKEIGAESSGTFASGAFSVDGKEILMLDTEALFEAGLAFGEAKGVA